MKIYDDAYTVLMGYASKLPVKPGVQDPLRPARARAMLGALGDPHLCFPVIHVTGTKGKGSVSAMCASILRANGLRVGMYTSPHLQDMRERFQINGRMIDKDTLTAAVFERLLPVWERIDTARYGDVRFPEVMFTAAMALFAQQKVDVAVVEVSVGGRLDATNVVYPAVSVITSISLDHVDLLGDTVEKIAWEKAGIIKPGLPVVSAPQEDGARAVIERIADERGALLTLVGRDVPFMIGDSTLDGQYVTVDGREYKTALLGRHQAVNTAVALAALNQLRVVGIEVSDDAVDQGLREVKWAGRLEIVEREPLMLFDSAHNPDSALRLREALEAIFPQKPLVLVYGSKATKAIAAILEILLPLADHVVLTQGGDPPTEDPVRLLQFVRESGYQDAIIQPDLGRALVQARALAGESGVVCLTGSMYIVGAARSLLGLMPE